MINRAHIEFVQSQMLPWRRIGAGLARPDAEYKLLSRDAGDGACSLLLRYPPGWSREGPEFIDAAEEFYVLDGSLQIDDHNWRADSYGWLPAGLTRTHMHSPAGCVMLAFYDAEPVLRGGQGPKLAQSLCHVVATELEWDLTLYDPHLRHLGIGRKNLRTDPDTGERTFLSLILPQSAPENGQGPQEMHPVVEEAFVLSGSLASPHGTMQPGAYFWRPPMIPHGPFGAHWGAVSLIRFVGGRHVNLWTHQHAKLDMRAPYAPVLPPELAHLAQTIWQPAPAW